MILFSTQERQLSRALFDLSVFGSDPLAQLSMCEHSSSHPLNIRNRQFSSNRHRKLQPFRTTWLLTKIVVIVPACWCSTTPDNYYYSTIYCSRTFDFPMLHAGITSYSCNNHCDHNNYSLSSHLWSLLLCPWEWSNLLDKVRKEH